MAALKTRVEQMMSVECLQEPLRERAGTRISHLAYSNGEGKKVWTAMRNRSGLTTNKRNNLSKNAGDNIGAVAITRR